MDLLRSAYDDPESAESKAFARLHQVNRFNDPNTSAGMQRQIFNGEIPGRAERKYATAAQKDVMLSDNLTEELTEKWLTARPLTPSQCTHTSESTGASVSEPLAEARRKSREKKHATPKFGSASCDLHDTARRLRD